MNTCAIKTGFSGLEMAEFLNISRRTLTDWKREKFLMPLLVVRKLCAKSKLPLPKNVSIVPEFWYTSKAGRIGGNAVVKKYGAVGGNSDARRAKWRRWWKAKGRFQSNPLFTRMSFQKPKPDEKLAEFFGVMMGDGGMSRFQIKITLHHKDDLEFTQYVIHLIRHLFKIKPSVYHRPKLSVNDIVISRIGLVDYLHFLGLPIGNKIKQKFDISNWIKTNKDFSINCVRGLVDTDGSVVIHKYRVNKKLYSYKKLEFTSLSRPMLDSVFKIMKDNGLHPRIARGRAVHLDSQNDVDRYFEVFGSHNPKHLMRYRQ